MSTLDEITQEKQRVSEARARIDERQLSALGHQCIVVAPADPEAAGRPG
jgi:hypothetical protein